MPLSLPSCTMSSLMSSRSTASTAPETMPVLGASFSTSFLVNTALCAWNMSIIFCRFSAALTPLPIALAQVPGAVRARGSAFVK